MNQKDNLKRRCYALLTALLGSQELVERWWVGPNKAFDMRHPIDVFEEDPHRVYNYLMDHCRGDYM